MKCWLIIISLLFTTKMFGQFKHELFVNKNDKEIKLQSPTLYVVVDKDTIHAKRHGNVFELPNIHNTKKFNLFVKNNDIEIEMLNLNAWMLNRNSRLFLGKLTKIDKLLSVAKYNDETPDDELWKIHSERFFILDKMTTLDIENHMKIKELHYLIFLPSGGEPGTQILTQKIIKYR
ncbi:hypothetical protein D3C71_00040 [compost metagenome]